MNCIVNVSQDWGIGFGGQLLAPISADLRRFRQLTTGKTVILGRRTLATFPGGRPLKNRRNLVLTTDRSFHLPDAEVFFDLPALLSAVHGCDPEELCVIGGEAVYRQLLPYCHRAQITRALVQRPADAFFPNLDALPDWELAGAEPVQEEDGVRFQYVDYVNRNPLPY